MNEANYNQYHLSLFIDLCPMPGLAMVGALNLCTLSSALLPLPRPLSTHTRWTQPSRLLTIEACLCSSASLYRPHLRA